MSPGDPPPLHETVASLEEVQAELKDMKGWIMAKTAAHEAVLDRNRHLSLQILHRLEALKHGTGDDGDDSVGLSAVLRDYDPSLP